MPIGDGQSRKRAMIVLGGLAAALLVLSIPIGLIETLVASSGISESLPAAAPPLGLKAQFVLAGFVALMTMGLMDMMRRTRTYAAAMDEEGRMPPTQGARQMGFAFSKLTALARGRITGMSPVPVERPAPALRRADAHPDAPARAPIFASRDFSGLDIFARPDRIERVEWTMPAEDDLAASAPDMQELAQPTFLRSAVAESEAVPLIESQDALPDEPWPAPQVQADPVSFDPAPTHGLTITQLTERLERGLSLRSRAPTKAGARVIADMPVAAPVPVRDHVARDADDALRAALGALRTMAGRAR